MTDGPGLARRRRSRLGLAWAFAAARARSLWRSHPTECSLAGGTASLGLTVGLLSLWLQGHFQAAYGSGAHLAGWQNLLRLGAPWQALLPVAAAGLLALLGAARLRLAPAEPPISWGREPQGGASGLRRAMRRELQVVRLAVLAAGALVGVVLVRVLVYWVASLVGDPQARSTLPGVALELAVWAAAWGCFWIWFWLYRRRLGSWGVSA
ncbi:MAG: hypothetical protein ACREN4_06550 [Candidatus Dormibacteria bacterium]